MVSGPLAPRAGFIEAVDPSHAVLTAQGFLADLENVRLTQAGVDELPFPNESFDFVFSLGVLHHVPDTRAAMRRCVEKLKPGGYFLVYLYYDLDNRGRLYRSLFECSTRTSLFSEGRPQTGEPHVRNDLGLSQGIERPVIREVEYRHRLAPNSLPDSMVATGLEPVTPTM